MRAVVDGRGIGSALGTAVAVDIGQGNGAGAELPVCDGIAESVAGDNGTGAGPAANWPGMVR